MIETTITVIRRPVKFIVAIRFVDSVFCLISRWIDKCKRLACHDLPPNGAARCQHLNSDFCGLKSKPQKRARLEFEADRYDG
jgi:hypothetical protein